MVGPAEQKTDMGVTVRADTAHQRHRSKCSVQGQGGWPHTQKTLHLDPCLGHTDITAPFPVARKKEAVNT